MGGEKEIESAGKTTAAIGGGGRFVSEDDWIAFGCWRFGRPRSGQVVPGFAARPQQWAMGRNQQAGGLGVGYAGEGEGFRRSDILLRELVRSGREVSEGTLRQADSWRRRRSEERRVGKE